MLCTLWATIPVFELEFAFSSSISDFRQTSPLKARGNFVLAFFLSASGFASFSAACEAQACFSDFAPRFRDSALSIAQSDFSSSHLHPIEIADSRRWIARLNQLSRKTPPQFTKSRSAVSKCGNRKVGCQTMKTSVAVVGEFQVRLKPLLNDECVVLMPHAMQMRRI